MRRLMLVSLFALCASAAYAQAPPKTFASSLYIVTNANTTLVASFNDMEACVRGRESMNVRTGPVINQNSAPSFVTAVCINNK
jgi:hypothetical protein